MKVLIDWHGPPFFLAHGGADIQIRRTSDALRQVGVETEFANWWDAGQSPDLIHTFSPPDSTYLAFAREKGIPVVCTTLFTAGCNRPGWHLRLKGALVSGMALARKLPVASKLPLSSRDEAFLNCDCNVVGLEAEVDVLKTVYGVPQERIRKVPLGLSDEFLNAAPGERQGGYLITMGTITERKRSLEIARMAHAAKATVLFVGKPYSESSDYWRKFQALVDDKHVKHVRHTDDLGELIELIRGARGYVLNSYYENWCLAAHEAIACGIPLLLPDQRWSRERFGDQAWYFPSTTQGKIDRLAGFYQQSPDLPVPDVKLYSWVDVAEQLKDLYVSLTERR